MEDVSLAVELLQAGTVAELANRDVEYAEPDKVDCNQGHGGKPDDNLDAFAARSAHGSVRDACRAKAEHSQQDQRLGRSGKIQLQTLSENEEGRKSVSRRSRR